MRLLTNENQVFMMKSLEQQVNPDPEARTDMKPKDVEKEVSELKSGFSKVKGEPKDDMIRYFVIDCTEPEDIDICCIPMFHWETFEAPGFQLEVGQWMSETNWKMKWNILMPMDWHILMTGQWEWSTSMGELELISLKEINDRDFWTPVFNPLTQGSMMSKNNYYSFRCRQTFANVQWSFPKLTPGHVMAIPLVDDENPPCIFMCGETKHIPKVMNIADILC